MRACLLITILALAPSGCGGKEPASAPRSDQEAPLVACPVEGTMFRKGTGVPACPDGFTRTVEVCSPGCRYRFELEPK